MKTRAGVIRIPLSSLCLMLGFRVSGPIHVKVQRTRNRGAEELVLMIQGDPHLPELEEMEDAPDVMVTYQQTGQGIKVMKMEALPRDQWGGW